jgi:hypothetical protein
MSFCNPVIAELLALTDALSYALREVHSFSQVSQSCRMWDQIHPSKLLCSGRAGAAVLNPSRKNPLDPGWT